MHPHVVSVLMDEATLLEHRDVWGSEPQPSTAELTRLTEEESALYYGSGEGHLWPGGPAGAGADPLGLGAGEAGGGLSLRGPVPGAVTGYPDGGC